MKKTKEPLAIIGIGARFPGDIYGPDQLWQALKKGKNCITEIPKDRWNIDKYYDPDPDKSGKIKAKKGGFIKGMKEFDAEFFDIFPKVANALDPRQRHLLEVVYESLEDAGLTLDDINDSNTSVIMGVFLGDESKKIAGSDLSSITPHTAMGGADTTVSARIAYQFNLKGPTLSVDTACSSSLTAIHLACNSLWMNDTKMAIAGGVNIMASHEHTLQLSKGGFLSPDGYCKAFDASGNGYVRGEGAGVIIIKPLKEAQKDKNDIYAIIRNTAVNSDGYTSDGITVPNEFAQIEMLKKVYGDVEINPKDVDYIEAHGTGTVVGDPKETFAFGNIFAEGRTKDKPLMIGSIKTNFGHTEAVAGVAGLIKLALCIKNKQIPKNLHFKNPNPKIKFDEWKLRVPTKLTPWPKSKDKNKKAIGGVNSFGAGGSNAHIVLEEYISDNNNIKKISENKVRKIYDFPHIFCLSAKSKEALKDLAKKHIKFVSATNESLSDICYSLITKRSLLPEKIIITTNSKETLLEALDSYLKEEKHNNLISGTTSLQKNPKIAFVCSGQGPQWYGMGRQLIQTSKIFRDTVNQIDKIFKDFAGYSLLTEMNKSATDSRIGETRIAQPAIMAVQIGLIHMWKSFGIEPEGVVGHSIGEVAAAYAAGALTLKQAVEVIYNRSKEQDRASGKGKMLAVGLSHSEILPRIEGFKDRVSVAAINGPEMIVLSGDVEPLTKIAQSLTKEEIFNQILRVNVPFHSHHMDPIKQDMLDGLKDLKPSKAKINLYSTVTGRKEDGLHLTSQYWYDNVRDTVYFTAAIEKMLEENFDYFIEIAPHPVLGGGINDILLANKKEGEAISCLSRKIKDFEANIRYEDKDFMSALSKAYIANVPIKFNVLFDETKSKFIKLPLYAWQHKQYWLESKEHEEARLGKPNHPFIKSQNKQLSNRNSTSWDLYLNKEREMFLKDHQIGGTIVFPGAAQIEAAYEAGIQNYGDQFSHLENIQFPLALFLPEDESIPEARLEIDSSMGDYKIFSRQKVQDNWNHNGSGRMCHVGEEFKSFTESLKNLKDRLIKKENEIIIDDFYDKLKSHGLNYGPHFKLSKQIWQKDDEILAKIQINESDIYAMNKYHLIPSLSDACLHIILKSPEDGLYLPHSYEKYKIYDQQATRTVWSYAKTRSCDENYLLGDVTSFNEDEKLILEAHGIKLKYLENSRTQSDDPYDGVYEYQWVSLDGEKKAHNIINNDPILLFADGSISKDLVKLFNKSGYEVILVRPDSEYKSSKNEYYLNPSSKEDMEKLFSSLKKDKTKISKIVNLWPINAFIDEGDGDIEFASKSQSLIEPYLYLFQEIIQIDYDLQIFLVTSGADLVKKEDKNVNFIQGMLHGMSRVLVNEYPSSILRMIDISSERTKDDVMNLHKEIVHYDSDKFQTEVAIRSYGRFARKLTKITQQDSDNNSIERVSTDNSTFFIEKYKTKKNQDEFLFRKFLSSEIKDDEVEIDVKYMSIPQTNSLIDNYSSQNQLSGIVKSVGANIKHVKPQDEIIAITPESMSGTIILNGHSVIKKPSSLSLKQASIIAVPYITAYFILHKISRISQDDIILIQDGQSELGIALIRLSKLANSKVIVISNDESCDDIFQNMGVDHVVNHGSNFYRSVMDFTEGKGVSLSINSSYKGMLKNSYVRAPFSSVISLMGQERSNLPQTISKNISFNIVDMDQLFTHKADLVFFILESIVSIFEKEQIDLNQISEFKIRNINKASKKERSKKLGESIILKVERDINLLPAKEIQFSSDATYLITGGTSGLGLAIADWMYLKGARNFALISRNGPKYSSDLEIIQKMRNNGANIIIEEAKADITKSDDVDRVMEFIDKNMPPLKGVVHSAGLLEDATCPNMTINKFMKVYNPKALGAWNLHQATKNLDLNLFLMISSVSSIIGSAGQGNYSVANNLLNYLSIYRNLNGLVSHSACLGLLDGKYAGMSKGNPKMVEMVHRTVGTITMSKKVVKSKIEDFLLSNSFYRMLSPMKWSNFASSYPHSVYRFSFKNVLETELNNGLKNKRLSGMKDSILLENSENQITKTTELLQEALSGILGIPTKDVDINKSITNIGLDSLMLNQFRNWIQSNMEINFPLMKLAKGPSLIDLSSFILEVIVNSDKKEDSNKEENILDIANDDDLDITPDKWLIRARSDSDNTKKIKIFCLHPVGAGASIFSHFMFNPPQNTEIISIQMPGRENRLSENYYIDMEKLIPDLAGIIASNIDCQTIFWGHSWGGVTLYEIIKYLRRTNNAKYQNILQLIVTGSIAPQLTVPWKDRDSIRETAKKSNNIDKILSTISYIDDENFIRQILPIMRKDMELITTYIYKEERKLDLPILAFGAKEDDVVLLEELERWQDQTSGNFTLHAVHGDHWFLSRNQEFILKKIEQSLSMLLAPEEKYNLG